MDLGPTPPAHSPTTALTLRGAEPSDWVFLDHLQRRHHDAIGYLPRVALEEAIDRRRVLLALENGAPAGYLYGKATYQRRADVAIIFQAAICFDARRRQMGTALVNEFLGRLPADVRQVCLWCASDLDANQFWSALGFEAVACRAGSQRTGRTHVFWCRHINGSAGTFWAPDSTHGGAMRETRAVVRVGTSLTSGVSA
ncbi:hypothetical protein J8F10_13585 [Gemmata sp. G18]|uniref:N-acetyltransferase domain-containing protein n=1 Tax=Gemmata palustris TaxID=2822762 RepID=A0ABS5BRF1_9BACT|nr:GNAT family N-acetyltransferase [Gemmata palustris]MBP3956317.1 hypothetical protein [Gemmata palustris]